MYCVFGWHINCVRTYTFASTHNIITSSNPHLLPGLGGNALLLLLDAGDLGLNDGQLGLVGRHSVGVEGGGAAIIGDAGAADVAKALEAVGVHDALQIPPFGIGNLGVPRRDVPRRGVRGVRPRLVIIVGSGTGTGCL